MFRNISINTLHKGDDDDDDDDNNNRSTYHNTGCLFYLPTVVFHFRWYFSANEDNWTDGIRHYDKRADRKWQSIVVR